MKKFKGLVILLMSIFLVSCSDSKKLMDDYPKLTDSKHIFEVIDGVELIKHIENKETFLVIMGFKDCPWCQAIMPVLNETAKQENLTKIYYLDIKDMRDNVDSPNHADYLKLKNIFKECLDKTKDRINAPTLVGVKKGKITDFNLDTVSTHVLENNILPPLTLDQTNELKDIIRRIINTIK